MATVPRTMVWEEVEINVLHDMIVLAMRYVTPGAMRACTIAEARDRLRGRADSKVLRDLSDKSQSALPDMSGTGGDYAKAVPLWYPLILAGRVKQSRVGTKMEAKQDLGWVFSDPSCRAWEKVFQGVHDSLHVRIWNIEDESAVYSNRLKNACLGLMDCFKDVVWPLMPVEDAQMEEGEAGEEDAGEEDAAPMQTDARLTVPSMCVHCMRPRF